MTIMNCKRGAGWGWQHSLQKNANWKWIKNQKITLCKRQHQHGFRPWSILRMLQALSEEMVSDQDRHKPHPTTPPTADKLKSKKALLWRSHLSSPRHARAQTQHHPAGWWPGSVCLQTHGEKHSTGPGWCSWPNCRTQVSANEQQTKTIRAQMHVLLPDGGPGL